MSNVLAPFIFLAISVGLFFTYIKPAHSTLVEFQDQQTKLEDVLGDAKTLGKRLNTLLNTYAGFNSTDMKRLEKMVPDSVDAVRLIIDIDALAEKNHVTLNTFDVPRLDSGTKGVSLPGVPDALGSATLSVTCSGRYDDFKAFLMSLEDNLTLFDVTVLALDASTGQGTEGAGIYNYTLSMRTYWLK